MPRLPSMPPMPWRIARYCPAPEDTTVSVQNRTDVAVHRHYAVSMRRFNVRPFVFVALTAGMLAGCGMITGSRDTRTDAGRASAEETSPALIAEGQRVFRFDTFGDEQVWTVTLRLHEIVEKSVVPLTALKVGFKVDSNNHITQLGVTCAFCHSTVDNSVMPGIGLRQDGWPNRDLNVGAIIALSPVLSADKKAVYA